MSVVYGGMEGYGQLGYTPPRKVNFNWISESWNVFSRAAGIWIGAVLIYGVISNIINALLSTVFPNPAYVAPPNPFGVRYDFGVHYGTNSNLTPLGQVISILVLWTYGAFQNASLYRVAVKQVRGEAVTFGDAFSGGPYFGNMLILNLLVALASLAGVFALCVGLLVVVALFLPSYALVADGESAATALSRSFAAMKSDWLSATLFVLVFSLVIAVSLIPCGLGLFVTLPMLHMVSALAYRDMIGMPNLAVPTPQYSVPQYSVPQAGVWPPPPTTSGQAPPLDFGQPPPPPPEPPRPPLSGEAGGQGEEQGNVWPPSSPPAP